MQRVCIAAIGVSCFVVLCCLVGTVASAARCAGLRESMRELPRRRHDRREGTVDTDLRPLPRRQGNRRSRPQGPSRRSGSDARCRAAPDSCGDAKLAGTNPAMATGGYTGSRRPGRRLHRFLRRSRGPTRRASAATTPTTIKMADGSSRTGILLGQSLTCATLLESGNTKFTLLSRDGDVYREKPIAPKRDWLFYDGSHTGNRYSTLDQINARMCSASRRSGRLPMPESRPQNDAGRRRRHHVRDRMERAAGARCDDGANAVVIQRAAACRDRQRGRHRRESRRDHRRRSRVHDHGSRARARIQPLHRPAAVGSGDGLVPRSYSATSPPLPVGDLLVVGVAGGEEGARGFLDAYRASTGERVWRFYTIPKRGEKGSETWIGQALEHGCGATWMPGSYDPELDLIYWAIGNPCPDFAGEERHRRQPLHVERRCACGENRRTEVVLPVHAARYARLGRRAADGACR